MSARVRSPWRCRWLGHSARRIFSGFACTRCGWTIGGDL